jgi:hypothetical protein
VRFFGDHIILIRLRDDWGAATPKAGALFYNAMPPHGDTLWQVNRPFGSQPDQPLAVSWKVTARFGAAIAAAS